MSTVNNTSPAAGMVGITSVGGMEQGVTDLGSLMQSMALSGAVLHSLQGFSFDYSFDMMMSGAMHMPMPAPGCFPQQPVVCPPDPCHCGHPPGSIQVDPQAGVITTPGGYQIKPIGKHEWSICTPDGKKTRVWGDPHVDEGDGGKWDFKRDSVFCLPDGTKIMVDTVPWGNKGMTVTGKLTIVNNQDAVEVTGIDQGKGKIQQPTLNGVALEQSFSHLEQFHMAGDGDDWILCGKEIIGSNGGGDSFKLGNQMAALRDPTPTQGRMDSHFMARLLAHMMGRAHLHGGAQSYGNNLAASALQRFIQGYTAMMGHPPSMETLRPLLSSFMSNPYQCLFNSPQGQYTNPLNSFLCGPQGLFGGPSSPFCNPYAFMCGSDPYDVCGGLLNACAWMGNMLPLAHSMMGMGMQTSGYMRNIGMQYRA